MDKLGAIAMSSDILAKANIGLWAFELDEGMPPRMYVDATMLKILGLSEQKLPEETYHAWYDHVDENAYGLVADAVEKMAAGERAEAQYPWHHPDGGTMIVRCGGVRNYEYTKGIRIEGTHQDVSAVIHFQKEKDAEKDAVRKYIFNSVDSAYYIGLDDDVWLAYKTPRRFEGDSFPRKNYLDVMRGYIARDIHPDDRELAAVMVQPKEIKKRLARQTRFDLLFRDTSGEEELTYLCEIARGADESHIVMSLKDVTGAEKEKKERAVIAELAKQRQNQKAFGDMINGALWSVHIGEDDQIKTLYLSDEYRRMFDVESTGDDSDIWEMWASRLHPEDRERTLEHFNSSLKSRDTEAFVYDVEYRIIRRNDECCWFHAAARMEKNEDGTRNMFGIVTDISADKRLEEKQRQLEEALVMAQEANRAKTDFLFNMSHDIRTPLNAILGFAEMAEKCENNPSRVADCHAKIMQSGTLLLSLINSVLDMSRIESGKAEINEKPGAMDFTFVSIEATMQALAKRKGIALDFEIGEIMDGYVYADHERCNRIFVNIISNAIKYTEAGGKVKVRCEQIGRQDEEHGLYRYTFEDNGIGMSEEFQKKAFDEFTRENNSTISGVQGSGLGLRVVKTFVDLMHGTVECKSKQGEGSTFIVTLPFRLQKDDGTALYIDPDTRESRSAFLRNEKERGAILSGRRVLLVEDNELNREIAAFILIEEGMIVDESDDGAAAVAMVREKGADHYDAILMDIQMPTMSGYEATKAIRQMYPDAKLPIIALSANAFAEDKAKSIAMGMNDHIAKPIEVLELLDALAKCMK